MTTNTADTTAPATTETLSSKEDVDACGGTLTATTDVPGLATMCSMDSESSTTASTVASLLEAARESAIAISQPTQPITPRSQQEWMEGITAGIQAMPSPPRRPPPLELEYDHRGRVLKRAFLQHYTGPEPGAYAEAPGGTQYGRTRAIRPSRIAGLPGGTSSQGTSRPANLEAAAHELEMDENNSNDNGPIVLDRSLQQETKWWHRKPFLVAALAVLFLLVLAIVVAPLMILQGNSSEDLAMGMESNQDGQMPKDELDITLVPNMTNVTRTALQDYDSPQYRAYDWISRDPGWDTFEDWRKQQRFALACFYYAIGEATTNPRLVRFRLSYYHDECDWIPGVHVCNDKEEVSILCIPNLGALDSPSGYIPPEVALLPQLERLDFYGLLVDTLEGFLPLDTPGGFSSLQELRLHDCDLDGTIPSTLGLLTRLTHLDLSGNAFSSTIPSELGLLSNLSSFLLQSNDLNGSLPKEFGDLSSLQVFHIEDNPGIEQFIPDEFCKKDQSLDELGIDWCSTPAECCTPA